MFYFTIVQNPANCSACFNLFFERKTRQGWLWKGNPFQMFKTFQLKIHFLVENSSWKTRNLIRVCIFSEGDACLAQQPLPNHFNFLLLNFCHMFSFISASSLVLGFLAFEPMCCLSWMWWGLKARQIKKQLQLER